MHALRVSLATAVRRGSVCSIAGSIYGSHSVASLATRTRWPSCGVECTARRAAATTAVPGSLEGDDGKSPAPHEPRPSAAADGEGAKAAAIDFHRDGMPAGLDDDAHAKARESLIQEILSRDKEVFELKRQHELSMLRVDQHQRRMLKDQEDRGMYYEQNVNVHTFDTISVGLHTQRLTLHHTLGLERLRNFKIFLTLATTIVFCVYLYYRYMINPEWDYVEVPMKLLGSRVQALRDMQWKNMNEEEKREQLEHTLSAYSTKASTK